MLMIMMRHILVREFISNSLLYFSQRVEPVTNSNKHLLIAIPISFGGNRYQSGCFSAGETDETVSYASTNDCDVYEAIINNEPINIRDRIYFFEFLNISDLEFAFERTGILGMHYRS